MKLRLLVLAALVTFVSVAPSSFADSRSEFLKLIDRPRVALAPEAAPPVRENSRLHVAFSFAAEASQRVPGILVKSADSTGRRPVVIALHGTGGNKEKEVALLNDFADEGFVAVAIDGRYHGARSKTGSGGGDYEDAILRAFRSASSTTEPHEHPFFFDTAWDVMRLIDYLGTRTDVDVSRIGLIGFSKGGIETYLAAAADPRVAVAVPCIGVESFRWALDHDELWRRRIETVQSAFDAAAKESHINHPDAGFVRIFYDRVAPGIYDKFDGPAMLPLIAPRPLLCINGELDGRTPPGGLAECADAAQAAYKAAGAENRFVLHIQPKAGHTVTPASMKLAHAWFVYWLKP